MTNTVFFRVRPTRSKFSESTGGRMTRPVYHRRLPDTICNTLTGTVSGKKTETDVRTDDPFVSRSPFKHHQDDRSSVGVRSVKKTKRLVFRKSRHHPLADRAPDRAVICLRGGRCADDDFAKISDIRALAWSAWSWNGGRWTSRTRNGSLFPGPVVFVARAGNRRCIFAYELYRPSLSGAPVFPGRCNERRKGAATLRPGTRHVTLRTDRRRSFAPNGPGCRS